MINFVLDDVYYNLKSIPLMVLRYHAYRIDKFVRKAGKMFDKKGKTLIDIGAQTSPYKKYFSRVDYFTQDIVQNKNKSINFVCDINDGLTNVKTGTFDFILCTQVLEHIRKPEVAFEEFYRVLKPGGRLFLTTHMCFEEHMIPFDYFRFTKYGLIDLGKRNKFKVGPINAHGGFFVILAYIIDTIPIKLFIKRDTIFYYLYLLLFIIPIFIMNTIFLLLDRLDSKKEMTLNFDCTYIKK